MLFSKKIKEVRYIYCFAYIGVNYSRQKVSMSNRFLIGIRWFERTKLKISNEHIYTRYNSPALVTPLVLIKGTHFPCNGKCKRLWYMLLEKRMSTSWDLLQRRINILCNRVSFVFYRTISKLGTFKLEFKRYW